MDISGKLGYWQQCLRDGIWRLISRLNFKGYRWWLLQGVALRSTSSHLLRHGYTLERTENTVSIHCISLWQCNITASISATNFIIFNILFLSSCWRQISPYSCASCSFSSQGWETRTLWNAERKNQWNTVEPDLAASPQDDGRLSLTKVALVQQRSP